MLAALSGCFTAPSWVSFEYMLSGWVLCTGRRTVTGLIRAAEAVGVKHHSSFHRLFRSASWDRDAVSRCLIRLVCTLLPAGEPIVVPLDDTLARHTGKRIRAASMHHDPLLSTRVRPVFHWGHVWVVLSLVVRVPLWRKAFALPVLVRLYRSEKLCAKERRVFRKKTELAAEMIGVLSQTLPERTLVVVGDAAYANASIVKKLPSNVHFIGRSRPDAALYALPQKKRMGRPRVKGLRVASPGQRAKSSTGWSRVTVDVYGKTVPLRVQVFDALWYSVGGGRLMRFILVRGWPGHQHDDVLCTTDLSLGAAAFLETYCLRWSLEVTFHETKGKLGLEHPQNRTQRAVERTAPMALWVYTLTVVWYLTVGKGLPSARLPTLPWYQKTVPAFSDMLATLRRETWRHRILQAPVESRACQKWLAPLLQALGYAA